MAKVLMKGNEAIAEAAVRAGCLNYFAYPITPQSADYFQAVKGAGHGDCRMLVLAPASVQEAADIR